MIAAQPVVPEQRERRALLALLRAAVNPGPAAEVTGADWPAVRSYAGVALAPLLLRGTRRGGIPLPAAVVAALEADQRRLAAVYLHRQAALRGICGALDEVELPFIVLKGAALAHLVYPDPLLRPMTDLDLWIPRARLEQAAGLASALGFRDAPDAGSAEPAGQRTMDSGGAVSIRLELHTAPKSLRGLSYGEFDRAWASARTVELGGASAKVPCDELLLVHAVLHMARADVFDTSLRQLMDVSLVLQSSSNQWNWNELAQFWRAQGIESWMLLGITLARDLLGAPVPASLESGLPPDRWRSMRELAEERLWNSRPNRLPQVVSRMARSGSTSATLKLLRARFLGHYWNQPAERGPMSVLAGGLRRMWYDLRIRVPRYLSVWRSGRLRGSALVYALSLERQRVELERLANGPSVSSGMAERAGPDPSPPPGG